MIVFTKGRMIVVVGFLMLFTIACATPSFILKDGDNGADKIVQVGDVFAIELQAKPGTGFSWHFKANNYIKKIEDSKFVSQRQGLPGGTELQIFKFKAIRKGKFELKLLYLRSWEDVKADKSFSIKLDIR